MEGAQECPSPFPPSGFEPETSWLWGCTSQPPSNHKKATESTEFASSASVSVDGSRKQTRCSNRRRMMMMMLLWPAADVSPTLNEQQATNSCNMWTNTDKQYPLYGAQEQQNTQLRPLKGLKLWEVSRRGGEKRFFFLAQVKSQVKWMKILMIICSEWLWRRQN